ncbi:MAG: hypothetical protein JNL70_12660 [Saprospiraceae bacterium]|nr:hypothetical protein [Saprospiraceae bacterium]
MQLSEIQPFTIRVLYIARYELALASALNFLYESGFDSLGALRDEEALELFKEYEPQLVIINQHVENNSKVLLKDSLLKNNASLTILEHEGGVLALKLLIENYYHV